MVGKRGYFLSDLQQLESQGGHPYDDQDYHEWFLLGRTSADELEAQRRRSSQLEHQPLISFLVPVFNPDPELLRDTIESVLAQTYGKWELCLADGASSKPVVREILRRYARKDARVRVALLEENQGISGNSNAAFQLANGEFIALLGP